MAAQIALTIAGAVLPTVINFGGQWLGKTIQVKGTNAAFDGTVAAMAKAAEFAFGGEGTIGGTIGYGLGTIGGYIAAPFAATSNPTQSKINALATAATIGAQVGGKILGTYLQSKVDGGTQTPEQPITEQLKEEYQKAQQKQEKFDIVKLTQLMETANSNGIKLTPMMELMKDARGQVDLNKVEKMLQMRIADDQIPAMPAAPAAVAAA